MNSQALSKSTLAVEVTNISSHGIWRLTGEKESPPKIVNVEEPVPGHYYWPELDVDLGIEFIEHVEQFPLKAKNSM